MKIGFISQWYSPEIGAGTLPSSITMALAKRGHNVTVLTGLPNYPEGKLYEGYTMRRHQVEQIDGIPVHRVMLYPSHDRNPFRRAANFLSFAVSATNQSRRALRDVDVCLVYSSPITAALPALWLARRHKVPYVLLIQDMWPQSALSGEMLHPLLQRSVAWVLHRFCDAIYRGAAHVAVSSPGQTTLVRNRIADETPVSFAPNWVDESVLHAVPADDDLRRELGISEKLVVMYAGNIGEMQGLGTVIEAADRLRTRTDIEFVLVGWGTARERLEHEANQLRLTNVRFVEALPASRMAEVLALADVHLVALRDDPLFQTTLPSKVQSAMACSRPIIGLVRGDAAQIISSSGSGLIAQPGDAESVCIAVLAFADKSKEEREAMGARGYEYYRQNMSHAVGAPRLEELLRSAQTGPVYHSHSASPR